MRRKVFVVSLAIVLLVASIATLDAQGNITLESLADQVANLFTAHDELANRVAAIETSIAPTRIPSATATPVPTHTPPATAISLPSPIPATVMLVLAHGGVRSGPGSQYNYLGRANKGDLFKGPFQEKEGWYQFCCINNNETAWIPKILVSLKDYAELTAWEKAQHASIQIDPRDLLRYNEQHIGKLVYYSNVYVFYWLEDGLLVFLDSTEYADPAFLIYPQTPLRILEEDIIDFVAEVVGLHTYDTAEGRKVTVPLLRIVELILLE